MVIYFPVEPVGLAFFLATPFLLTPTAIDVGELGINRDRSRRESLLSLLRDVNACNTCFSGKCAARQRPSKAYWNVTQREFLHIITCQNNTLHVH